MKDKIHNWLLNAKNWVLYKVFNKKYGNYLIPDNFVIDYAEDFRTMKMDEFLTKYRLGQAWGEYHPGDLHQWYDPAGVSLNNGLTLSITDNAKQFPEALIPHGVGLVVSHQDFHYGIFEWNIKLPMGVGLWPAVWLSSSDSWPPEIDVIEAYSDKEGKYKKNLQTNFHLGIVENKSKYALGEGEHGLYINPNEILNLKCHWTKDFIKIYYNNFLCRIVTKRKHLAWFDNHKMLVIMNAALRKDIVTNVPTKELTISPLKINDFKYYVNR